MTNTNENNSAINTNEGNAMTNDVNETIETETIETEAQVQAKLLDEAITGYQEGTMAMKEAQAHAGVGQNAFRMELARRKVQVTRGRNRDWNVNEAFAACQPTKDGEGNEVPGESAVAVAKRIGVAVGTLYSSFHKAGLSLSGDNNVYTEAHGVRAREIYETGKSMGNTAELLAAECADLTNVPASTTLRKMIVEAGGTIRKAGEGAKGGGRKSQEVSLETVAKVKAMREAGENSFTIAVETGLTLGVLNRVLKENGLTKSRKTAEDAPEVAPEAEATPEAPTAEDYDAKTVKSLLSLITEAGIELPEKRNKASLVSVCLANKLAVGE